MLRPIYLASVEELEEHPDKGVIPYLSIVSEIIFVNQVVQVVKVLMSDIIFVNQVVRVSPDNKGGMVGEDEHWVFLKRLLLSKENDNDDTDDTDEDDEDDEDDEVLTNEVE